MSTPAPQIDLLGVRVLLEQAFFQIRQVWLHRWIALGASALAAFAGWSYVAVIPDRYEVTAKVHVDTRSMLKPFLQGLAVDINVKEYAARLLQRTLITRPNLEEVARRTDLDLTARTPEDMEELLNELRDKVSLRGTGDNLYTISYEHREPDVAKRVVDSILDIFVERSLSAERVDTGVTKEFLDKQIKDYELKLEAAEERLKEFKRRNVGLMPGEGSNYFARLQGLGDELKKARLELSEAENRNAELHRQLESVSATVGRPSALQKGEPDPLTTRILDMETKLDDLLLRFTDQHPDVIATKEMLEQLKSRQEAEENSADALHSGREAYENPVYQELKVEKGKVEAEIAALRARVAEYESREAKLQELIDTVPQVEAELVKLNRDYKINKDQYESLVRRRESAEISYDAENASEELQIKVVEPPVLPLLPAGPKRALLNTAVLVGSVGFGIVLAWLLAHARPVFFDRQHLRSVTNLPVLGTVSMVFRPGQVMRRRLALVSYVLSIGALLSTYVLLVVVQPRAARVMDHLRALHDLIL